MRLRSKTALTISALAAVVRDRVPAGALPAFSTAPKSAPDPHPKHLTQLWQVRTANNGTFDRIVFDERFSPSGYTRPVRQARHRRRQRQAGARKGKFFLSVSLPNTSTSGAAGTPTNVHRTYTPLLPEVVQIKKTGEFEDVVSFGIGLRKRNGFRVFVLHDPLRLVVDVKH